MISFRKTAKIALILVYLVIIAGATVRMTGSGMGCPDWPKCFGYYVPPTDIETLKWQPDRDFKKGQVIILKDQLKVAKLDFVSGEEFNIDNWAAYTKHDYATFNVWHTWIEYINRLLGALAGFATLFLAIYSLKFWKTRKAITILSWAVVFGMGFQAWLGATVVYSVLEPVKITLHMLMALVIVAMFLYLIYTTKSLVEAVSKDKTITALLVVALILTLVQIILGTQVRQTVDQQIDLVGEKAKDLWLAHPTLKFYAHRSFSVVVFLLNGFLFWKIRTKKIALDKINWVMALIFLEIITGIAMYYFDFPFGTQALHLVIASLLFGVQFYLVLEALGFQKQTSISSSAEMQFSK